MFREGGRALWSWVRSLTAGARAGVAAGLAAFAASVVVFAGVSEDVVRHNGAATIDASRLQWIAHHRDSLLVSASKVVSEFGAVAVIAALAVIISGALWWRGLCALVAAIPAVAVLGAGAFAAVLKVLIDRARPPAGLRVVSETDPSFPSGHATGAMALGVSVAIVLTLYVLRRPLARAAALMVGTALPMAVGASRLELGVHWPTDVAAGLALGALLALGICGVVLAIVEGPGRVSLDRAAARHRVVAALAGSRGDLKRAALRAA